MTDGVRVAREALQAIRKRHMSAFRESDPDYHDSGAGLDALEAAEAALAERDEKIRAQAQRICDRANYRGDADTTIEAGQIVGWIDGSLSLLAAKTTTEPNQWCPCCHAYHAKPIGEKQDSGTLVRECPRNPYPERRATTEPEDA